MVEKFLEPKSFPLKALLIIAYVPSQLSREKLIKTKKDAQMLENNHAS